MGVRTPVGQFCWWSLMNTDVGRANRFDQDLFGWTLITMEFPDGNSSTSYHAGKGGFANPVRLGVSFPVRGNCIISITVKDVDQACRQVDALSGTVGVPPFAIPGVEGATSAGR